MLLTIDLGNTSLKLGLFDKDEQISFLCIDGIKDKKYKNEHPNSYFKKIE